MAHERDERWVYVALAVLAIGYVIYRYRGAIDLPAVPWRRLRGVASALPYLLATFAGVFFQAWNRRRLAAIRKKWEADLRLEGIVRQGTDLTVWVGGRKRQSLQADVYMTRTAVYVFDRGRRREPMRLGFGPATGSAVLVGAALRPGEVGASRSVRVSIGGASDSYIEFASPDAQSWWVEIRRALGQPTDVEAELAAGDEIREKASPGSVWAGIVEAVRDEIEVRREP